MTINVFLPFFSLLRLLCIERENIIGCREKQSSCLLIFSMGSFGEYFLFYGLTEFIYAYRSGLKALSSSSCPRFFPLFLPGVWRKICPHLLTTTSVPKLIFFTPISADGRSSHFRLRVQANHFNLLPSGQRIQTPVGFYSVGDPSEVREYR